MRPINTSKVRGADGTAHYAAKKEHSPVIRVRLHRRIKGSRWEALEPPIAALLRILGRCARCPSLPCASHPQWSSSKTHREIRRYFYDTALFKLH